LITRRSVCYLPSFAWSIGRRRPAGQARRGLAVAVEEAPRYAEQYPLLGHCLAEVEVVRRETRAQWECLSAKKATRVAALAELARAELAHFACHGDFFADAPRESGLLLYEEWLRITDIEDKRFEALNLVVLAACWGANTTRLPGAVQVGLPNAFLQAGAAHVVASLWQVGDEAAIDLMRDFYRALRRTDPVRALAAAQRARIEEPPATWAGYVIFSDGVRARPYARLLLEGMTRLGF
jgi:CHAT domain-containing protein